MSPSPVLHMKMSSLSCGPIFWEKELMHPNDRGHSLSPQTTDARRPRSPSVKPLPSLGSCRSTRSTRPTRLAEPNTTCRLGAPGTRRTWRTARAEDLQIYNMDGRCIYEQVLFNLQFQCNVSFNNEIVDIFHSPQPMVRMNLMPLSSSNVLTRSRWR